MPVFLTQFVLISPSLKLPKNGHATGSLLRNRRYETIISLIYGCGLRLEEIRKLRVTDINWDRNVIHIHGKGSKERILPLDDSFSGHVKKHIENNHDLVYLFKGMEKGKPYARRTIQKIYDHACENAGINRTGGVHNLRHSYATHLLEQGVDINKIKTLLGHSSVKTTQIYTHVSSREICKIRSPLAGIIRSTEGTT